MRPALGWVSHGQETVDESAIEDQACPVGAMFDRLMVQLLKRM
jgi:hypothetical protein